MRSSDPRPARQRFAVPRLPLGTDALILLLCLYWALVANRAFLSGAQTALQSGLGRMAALVALLALLHFVLLAPLLWRPWAKPALALLGLVAASSSYFTQQMGVVLDPAMLRNTLRTDWPEARELLTPSLFMHVAVLWLPVLAFLWQVELRPRAGPWVSALRWGLGLVAVVALLLAQFQSLGPLMRNHKGLRYQVLPAAPLWSLPKSLVAQAEGAVRVREAIGLDAAPGPSWATAGKPRLLVLVVGETVRSANWGSRRLPDGSQRDTTPLLAAEPGLLHWPVVHTCGTDTETSVPCMFAPIGRRDYDSDRIRGQQSLLHVLARAGVKVRWIDNQSGCKGVCDELPAEVLQCDGGRCLDDALFARLPEALQRARQEGGTHLLVLHMLGNHGPAYHRRVPEGFAPYQPVCRFDDLSRCTQVEVVNAFDNVLRHTDRLLAAAWQQLRAAQGELDTALLFLPDHGESLGENGLFLHGLPYAIAPREQTEVPMVLGVAPGWATARGWSPECLASLPKQALHHDHLFHSVLTLLDVRTALYAREWDGFAACAR